MKKRILCFGDSNTWGYNPVNGSRYDENVRWPMVLRDLLGEDYDIIEEGQNGRTISCDDPWEGGYKSAMDYVIPMMQSHRPLDALLIMLGTNDMKMKFSLPAGDIAGGMLELVQKVKDYLRANNQATKIYIISPIWIGDTIAESYFGNFFDGTNVIVRSKQLAGWYQQVAVQLDCGFLDAAKVAQPGTVDALHLMPEGHLAIAKAVYDMLKKET